MEEILQKQSNFLKIIADNTSEQIELQKAQAIVGEKNQKSLEKLQNYQNKKLKSIDDTLKSYMLKEGNVGEMMKAMDNSISFLNMTITDSIESLNGTISTIFKEPKGKSKTSKNAPVEEKQSAENVGVAEMLKSLDNSISFMNMTFTDSIQSLNDTLTSALSESKPKTRRSKTSSAETTPVTGDTFNPLIDSIGSLDKSIIKLTKRVDAIQKILGATPAQTQSKALTTEENIEAKRQGEAALKAQLEQNELLKKILDAVTPGVEKEKQEEPGISLKGLGTALAVGLATVAGYIRAQAVIFRYLGKQVLSAGEALVKSFWKFMDKFPNLKLALTNFGNAVSDIVSDLSKGIRLTFMKLKVFLTDLPLKIMTIFDDLFLKLPPKVALAIGSVSKFLTDGIVGIFSEVKNAFNVLKTSSEPIAKAVKFFSDIGENIKNTFGLITGNIVKVDGVFQTISGKAVQIGDTLKLLFNQFEVFSKIFGAVSKAVSKILIPLTVILTLWDTVKGAVEGFEKDGFVGAIGGAIKGFFNSLVFSVLDLIKSILSWTLGALGFDSAEKFLDSFSFQDLFSGFIDSVIGGIKDVFNAITGFFSAGFDRIKNFLGIGVKEKQEQSEKSLAFAKKRLSDAESAKTLGAIGTDDKGKVMTSLVEINGQFNRQAAESEVASQGLRLMSEEEKAAYIERLQKEVTEAESKLLEAFSIETISDTFDKIPFNEIFVEPFKKLMSSLKDGFKTYIKEPLMNLFNTASQMWESLEVDKYLSSVSSLVEEKIINPVKELFEIITDSIDKYISQPLKTFFAPLVDFFKAIPEKLASIFEYVGIPEFKFNVLGKDFTIGPFYPFRPKQGDFKVSGGTSMQTSTSQSSDGKIKKDERKFTENIASVGKTSSDVLQTREVSTEVNGKQSYSNERLLSQFETKTGTSRISVDGKGLIDKFSAMGLKVDRDPEGGTGGDVQISNRAFEKIKSASQKGQSTIEGTFDIVKEDVAYQKLSWFDKRKVDLGLAKAQDLIKDPKYQTSNVEPAKPGAAPTQDTSMVMSKEEIAKEDAAYQKLSWWDRRKVDLGLSKATDLLQQSQKTGAMQPPGATPTAFGASQIAPSSSEGSKIYERSIRNDEMRQQESKQQAPVIVNAANTNVSNNKQNVVIPSPIRNQDSALGNYITNRQVLI